MLPMGKCRHGYMSHGYMSHGYISPNPSSSFIAFFWSSARLLCTGTEGASTGDLLGVFCFLNLSFLLPAFCLACALLSVRWPGQYSLVWGLAFVFSSLPTPLQGIPNFTFLQVIFQHCSKRLCPLPFLLNMRKEMFANFMPLQCLCDFFSF